MKLRHAAALALVGILIAGCGSQNSASKTPADFGCKISPQNALQMCLMIADDFKRNPDQFAEAQGNRSNSGMATTRITWGLKTPRGEFASQVICDINQAHNSVVYANLLEGPKTQEQADYLQSQGLCSDSN